MKLQLLKKMVRRRWESLHSFQGKLLATEAAYVSDIKSFGDRRYKATWEAAYCRLRAQNIYEGTLDSYAFITHAFNAQPEDRDYEYRDRIFEEFLLYPDGLDLIKQGLEQIFATSPDEQTEIRSNGFFELLARREIELRGTGVTVGPVRELAGTSA